jgi:hypothetical protein
MAEDHGKEPDDPLDTGRVEELEVEAGEVDLRLLAGWGFEADLEAFRARRAKLTQQVGDRGVAAGISVVLDLAPRPAAAQRRIGCEALPQVGLVSRDNLDDDSGALPS